MTLFEQFILAGIVFAVAVTCALVAAFAVVAGIILGS